MEIQNKVPVSSLNHSQDRLSGPTWSEETLLHFKNNRGEKAHDNHSNCSIGIYSIGVIQCSGAVFRPRLKVCKRSWRFSAWEKSKQYPEIHDLVKYLVYWVAGTKLIFLLLLTVIIIFADAETQRISVMALVIAILSFYWRLFPLIRKMDQSGQIEPKNYSIVLGGMIFVFVTVLLIAVMM